jgi:hypothetical protein
MTRIVLYMACDPLDNIPIDRIGKAAYIHKRKRACNKYSNVIQKIECLRTKALGVRILRAPVK